MFLEGVALGFSLDRYGTVPGISLAARLDVYKPMVNGRDRIESPRFAAPGFKMLGEFALFRVVVARFAGSCCWTSW